MRTNLSLAQPTGIWANALGYGALHRLNSVTSPAGAFGYSYDEPSTRLNSLTLPNGAQISNSGYDSMSSLTESDLLPGVGISLHCNPLISKVLRLIGVRKSNHESA